MGAVEDFIGGYFIGPVVNQTGQYNAYNTIAYALLIFAVFYILYEKILRPKNISSDKYAPVLISFVFLSAGLHVLKDIGILPKVVFDMPLIFILMSLAFLVSFFASLAIEKVSGVEYWKTLNATALVPAIAVAAFILLNSRNIAGLAYTLALFAISTAAIYLVHLKFPKAMTRENFAVLAAHMLDASSTFVSISFFGYAEQHVLPTFLIENFGPVAMFPLKFFVVGAILYLFDKDMEDKKANEFFKLVILTLGLAPGLRDTLRLAVPV